MHNSESITLRPVGFEDLEVLTEWNFDPEITRFFTPRPEKDLHQQTKWLENLLQSPTKRKFMIIDNHSGTCIGTVGLLNIDGVNKTAEIGITIGNRNYWGKPHGIEALNTCLQIAFDEISSHIVYSRVFENNLRALRFFEKAGFTTDGIKRDCLLKDDEHISMVELSITAEEFQMRKPNTH